ncbi:MAG: IS630 transposase-related protein [Xenococcaceae cyanobacterium MO_234.B1]|nr:IS630 transposase-related protein [Xenococcaceae cyanobacterium MO_234.B1]
MTYSLDLRKRVINYVENGGSVTKAAKVFQVGRASIYRWLDSEDLEPRKVTRRNRKLDWKALEKDVQISPEVRLIDRAKEFGVRPSAISYALKKMKITRKKNNFVIAKETDKKEFSTIEYCEN